MTCRMMLETGHNLPLYTAVCVCVCVCVCVHHAKVYYSDSANTKEHAESYSDLIHYIPIHVGLWYLTQ